MPVGFIERRPPRLPRLGVIHLGVKLKSQKGTEYPSRVDYFEVHADDHTSQVAVEAFRGVYGEKPRELDVIFPVDDPEIYMPTDLKSYRAGVGLWCKGTGQDEEGKPGLAVRVYDPNDPTLRGVALPANAKPGSLVTVPLCHTETCPYYLEKKCRLICRLQFLLPRVPGLGVWQLVTSSINSVQNIRGGVQFVRAFTGGRIAGIPLKLRLVPQEATVEGRKQTIYVLQLANEAVRLADVLEASQKSWAEVLELPEPEPVDEDEIPEDHFPAEAAAEQEAAQRTPAAVPAPDPARSAEIEALLAKLPWPPARKRATVSGWRAEGATDEEIARRLAALVAEQGQTRTAAAASPQPAEDERAPLPGDPPAPAPQSSPSRPEGRPAGRPAGRRAPAGQPRPTAGPAAVGHAQQRSLF